MNIFDKTLKIILEENGLSDNELNEDFSTLEDDIITFSSTEKGEEICSQCEQAFNYTLNTYKQMFPEFKKVHLYFDIIFPEETDGKMCRARLTRLNEITINLYPFLYNFLNGGISIDDMLDWHEYEIYTIAHELAHIAEAKSFNVKNIEELEKLYNNDKINHGKGFKAEFERLTGHTFSSTIANNTKYDLQFIKE